MLTDKLYISLLCFNNIIKKEEKMIKEKKAQFYIIAAFVIIVALIGLAGVYNYTYTKKEPQKFYDVADILNPAGGSIIDNVNYNYNSAGDTLNKQIETFLDLFANYTENHLSEDFSFLVLYGDIQDGKINALEYSRDTGESIIIRLGSDTVIKKSEKGILIKNQTQISVNADNSVNITLINPDGINNITKNVPLLKDNNFAFVITTSTNFSQYIESNLRG